MNIHHNTSKAPSIDRYAVVGHPIHHSKSPQIHALFAQQTQQGLTYEAILAPLDGFITTVTDFFARGGKGMNVTVPFKQEAWQLVTKRSQRAQEAGAVNTLWYDAQGVLWGDNTDGIGLVRDLTQNLKVSLADKQILILGAGGATRGIAGVLLAQKTRKVVVANRTCEKAIEIAHLFQDQGDIHGGGFDQLTGEFDLIIHATSAGLQGELPPLPEKILAPGGICYDLMYGQGAQRFLDWAKGQMAAQMADGLGMLVEQAAESFFIWRGIRPETQPVINYLRTITQ